MVMFEFLSSGDGDGDGDGDMTFWSIVSCKNTDFDEACWLDSFSRTELTRYVDIQYIRNHTMVWRNCANVVPRNVGVWLPLRASDQTTGTSHLIGVTRKGVWLFFVLLYPEGSPQRLKSNFKRHVTYFPPLPACRQINVNEESSLMSLNLSSQFSQFDLLLPDP